MRKIILPIALAATGFAMAADIEINGNVDFNFASYFNRDFDPTNAANQDIDYGLEPVAIDGVGVAAGVLHLARAGVDGVELGLAVGGVGGAPLLHDGCQLGGLHLQGCAEGAEGLVGQVELHGVVA